VTDDSPYRACGSITPRFQTLVGMRIGPGWTRAVKEKLGGIKSCTHLAELLGPVATTAFQTIFPIVADEAARKAKAAGRPAGGAGERPVLLNMCHIFASDGDAVRRLWPAHYTGGEADEAAD
jgi:hypothetical protein